MNADILSVIILAIGISILIGCLYYQIKKNGLKRTAIELIVYAEKIIGSGKGEEKMNYVIDKFIAYLPMPFRLLLTREMIKNFIQEVFDEIKDVLEYQSAGGQE